MPAPVQMKTLLEAGVHFGHQTRRWDPRMRPFIFTERNGIHIIDLQQLQRMLGGLRKTYRVPDMVFVVDPHREGIAVAEANRLKLPIIAMVDTNCNPQLIDWPVPSNDDAIRAVRLIAGKVADAIVEGREQRAAVMGEPLPETGLAEGEIEPMLAELPMMTEEDF